MKNSRLFRMIRAWRAVTEESLRYKVIVGRFLKKLKNRALLVTFNVWVEFRSKRRWLRGMINKACGGRGENRRELKWFHNHKPLNPRSAPFLARRPSQR